MFSINSRASFFVIKGVRFGKQRIQNAMTEHSIRTIGRYIHGNKFTAFIWTGTGRGMEYDGGITAEARFIEHEIFHSWFGRGIKPASQNDGWIDKGWNEYITNGISWKPFTVADPQTTLSFSNQFNRITPDNSYTDGATSEVVMGYNVLGANTNAVKKLTKCTIPY